MADELDGVIDSTGMVRRTFMRRLVTGTVFATPVVASFAMAGVEAASAAAHGHYPGPPQGNPNQTYIANPNQTYIANPNQTYIANPNQTCGLQPPIGNPNSTTGQNPGLGWGWPPDNDDGPPFGFWPPQKGFCRGR